MIRLSGRASWWRRWRAGFVRHHQKGSHLYLWNTERRRMTAVLMHPGDVHRGLIRAIRNQADLTGAEFLDLR